MNYSIRHTQHKGLDLVVLTDHGCGTELSILPAFGAILHGFSIRMGDERLDIIDHYDSLGELQSTLNRSYKSSKLSPFVCRIADGKYQFAGRQYEFAEKFPDGSAIHGLLFNKSFTLTAEESGPDSARAVLDYFYKKDDPQYPYEYNCQVTYTLLSNNVLDLQTRVTNHSEVAIPMADGWHPYFTLGGKVDDWLMQVNADSILEFNDKLIPTGRRISYDQFAFSNCIEKTELDNCFVVNPAKDRLACELYNLHNKVKLSFYPDDSYPYLQIYTPPHRNSIAIENLSAAPDCFNNQIGLLVIAPGASQTFGLRYKVSIA